MAKKIGTITITVHRGGQVDRLSDDSSAETSFQVAGCVVLPLASRDEEKGWVTQTGKVVYAPFGSDVRQDDEISLPGETHRYQVDGDVGNYQNKRGRGKVCIFNLEKVT